MKRRKCEACGGQGCFEYKATYHHWWTTAPVTERKYLPCLGCEGRGWNPEEPQREEEAVNVS